MLEYVVHLVPIHTRYQELKVYTNNWKTMNGINFEV